MQRDLEFIVPDACGLEGPGEIQPYRNVMISTAGVQSSGPAVGVRSGRSISLLTGDAVRSWLDREANLAGWRTLYSECPWGTLFQTPEFFRVWFEHYRSRWLPVLVVECDHGKLSGLMPLAAADGIVTGVGAHQAEYHAWLSAPNGRVEFFAAAVDEVLKGFPGHDLRLRYLPPGVPQDSVKLLLDRDGRAIVRTHRRPLLTLDAGAIHETLKKKGTRSKINRLKRKGALTIRRLTQEEFEQRIDEISAMYDFRQGAINDSCPFLDDAQKRPFHLDWVRTMPNAVHVSGMFIGEQLASAIIFALSKREAHVAITAHSPEHAENSPGKIHLYEAALALAREGFAHIDLTPGGEDWKFRSGTEGDEVFDLTVFANARKAALVRARDGVSAAAKSLLSVVRNKFGLAGARLPTSVNDAPETVICATSPLPPRATPSPANVRANDLSLLLKFGPGVARLSRQAFLLVALSRMQAGERCYALSTQQGIAGMGWRGADATAIRLFDFAFEKGANASSASEAIIRSMLADTEIRAGMLRVSFPIADTVLRSALQCLGFLG